MSFSDAEIVEAVLAGNRRALARLLTAVENETALAEQSLPKLFPHTGHAVIVGITGAPGTGKSSLVNALARAYRQQEKSVAIIAVDPTSPFSGGAILGDRIRMRDLSGDRGVFIRSMATRGSLGGLSRATRNSIRVMDAAGYDVILVETVGAGQSEVEIVRTAQTTIVVEAPGLGDDVQAIKAGILEIADILVINKADRPGARNTVRALKAMLDLGHPASRANLSSHYGQWIHTDIQDNEPEASWMPPLVETIALEEKGIPELVEAIAAHQAFLQRGQIGDLLARQRVQIELYDLLQDALMRRVLGSIPTTELANVVERVQNREIDPQKAVRLILEMKQLI